MFFFSNSSPDSEPLTREHISRSKTRDRPDDDR